ARGDGRGRVVSPGRSGTACRGGDLQRADRSSRVPCVRDGEWPDCARRPGRDRRIGERRGICDGDPVPVDSAPVCCAGRDRGAASASLRPADPVHLRPRGRRVADVPRRRAALAGSLHPRDFDALPHGDHLARKLTRTARAQISGVKPMADDAIQITQRRGTTNYQGTAAGNEVNEQLVAQGLPPYAEMGRLGQGWSTMATSAVAGLVVRPAGTTAYEIFNGYPLGGKSMIIDRLFTHCLVGIVAADSFVLWAGVASVKAAPTSGAFVVRGHSGKPYSGQIGRAHV